MCFTVRAALAFRRREASRFQFQLSYSVESFTCRRARDLIMMTAPNDGDSKPQRIKLPAFRLLSYTYVSRSIPCIALHHSGGVAHAQVSHRHSKPLVGLYIPIGP